MAEGDPMGESKAKYEKALCALRASAVPYCFLSRKEKGIMECNQEKNLERCNCTYEPCEKKGICCKCIPYHLQMRQLPACCFPKQAEATYDRSFEHFARLVQSGGV